MAARDVPRGTWLVASEVLDRPVPMSEPSPHICYHQYKGATGRIVTMDRVDCAACADLRSAAIVARAAREAAAAAAEPDVPGGDPP